MFWRDIISIQACNQVTLWKMDSLVKRSWSSNIFLLNNQNSYHAHIPDILSLALVYQNKVSIYKTDWFSNSKSWFALEIDRDLVHGADWRGFRMRLWVQSGFSHLTCRVWDNDISGYCTMFEPWVGLPRAALAWRGSCWRSVDSRNDALRLVWGPDSRSNGSNPRLEHTKQPMFFPIKKASCEK